jgi:hypothetical protein
VVSDHLAKHERSLRNARLPAALLCFQFNDEATPHCQEAQHESQHRSSCSDERAHTAAAWRIAWRREAAKSRRG